MMKIIFKFILVLILLMQISACKSINVENSNRNEKIKHQKTELSIYDFNKKLEEALKNKNINYFKSILTPEPINQYIERAYVSEYADIVGWNNKGSKLGKALNLGELFSTSILEMFKKNVEEYNWRYLYSLDIEELDLKVSLYELMTQDRFLYLKLYFDKNKNLVDIHSSSFKYSDIDFFIKLLALPFRLADKGFRQFELINKLVNDIKIVNMSGLESDLRGLDPEFKKSDVIYDYLLRLLARLPKESAIEFVNLIQKNIKYKSILLQPYLESYLNIYDDVEKIKYFENMLNFSQHDSHTLTLLSLLYARQGNFKTALSLGKEAVYKAPLDEVVYWNLLEVTIMAKRYELSTKVLRVLYEKFDVQLNNEIQAELEQFPDFVESDQYKIWLAENKIIIE